MSERTKPGLWFGGELLCDVTRKGFQIGESFRNDPIELGSLIFEFGEESGVPSLRRPDDLQADAIKFLKCDERPVPHSLRWVSGITGKLAVLVSDKHPLEKIVHAGGGRRSFEGAQVTVD